MASKRTPSQIAMRRIQVHLGKPPKLTYRCNNLTYHQNMMLLQSELTDWLLDDRRPEGCRLESFEPLLNWIIHIEGPQTPPYLYRGQTFR